MPRPPSNRVAAAGPNAGAGPTAEAGALRAGLLLLPALVLAAGVLRSDPYPRFAGAGWVLLALLPCALALLLGLARGERLPREALLGLSLLAVVDAVALLGPRGTDAFARRRALVLLAAGTVAFVGAASLDARGRRALAAGLCAVTVLFGLTALASAAGLLGGGPAHWAGVLGNPGPLSQALVPGAVVGALLLARGSARAVRALGALALGLALVQACGAPVLAAPIVIGGALVVAGLLARAERRTRGALLLFGALALALLGVAAWRDSGSAPAPAPQQAAAAAEPGGGGLAVRREIARGALALLVHRGAVGPGQFEAAFPPYRTVRETELSRDGVCAGGIRAVEHPHDDWLLGWVELGWIGGLAWLLLLLTGAWRALALLRAGAAAEAGLGAATLALLANGLVHGPLLVSPASSVLGFALLGAVGPRGPASGHTAGAARGAATGLAALLILAALPAAALAPALVRHGRALTRAVEALARVAASRDAGKAGAGPEEGAAREEVLALGRALADALQAAPDSVPALGLRARLAGDLARAGVPDVPSAEAEWEAVLTHRPHSFEALYELGLAAARAGDDATARARWEEALALQPTHPVLLRNMVRLAFHDADDAAAKGWLALLDRDGCVDDDWTEHLGEELAASGRVDAARALLARTAPDLAGDDVEADAAWADRLGKQARERGDDARADALEILADVGWAGAHADAGRWNDALRLFRQALARSRRHVDGGADVLRLELAAAALRAGRRDEAEAAVKGLTVSPAAARLLPPWAHETLEREGIVALPRP